MADIKDIINDGANIAVGEHSTMDISNNKVSDSTNIVVDDVLSDAVAYSTEYIRKMSILRNAYIKLDGLPLSFGLPAYSDDMPDEDIIKYFRTDIADAVRNTGIKLDELEPNTKEEMMLENRVVYYAIKRFRLTASAFFKFSTATDGKTVDKTQVPKMLTSILSDLDKEYKDYRLGNIGRLWNRGES